MKQPCVFILASRRNGTLYVGVTSNLVQRIWQHKNNLAEGFTKKYGIHTLVWFEPHETMESAIGREKAIKGMAARLEACRNRSEKPAVVRSVREHRLTHLCWIPACAGMTGKMCAYVSLEGEGAPALSTNITFDYARNR